MALGTVLALLLIAGIHYANGIWPIWLGAWRPYSMYLLCNGQNQQYVKMCYAAQHATQTA